MKIRYLPLFLVVYCKINAEELYRASIYKRQIVPEFYDERQTCKKISLYGQLKYIQAAIRDNMKNLNGNNDYSRKVACDQMVTTEIINIIKREIENREQLKSRFAEHDMDNACQCMDLQIKDLLMALASQLGVREAKEIEGEDDSETNDAESLKILIE